MSHADSAKFQLASDAGQTPEKPRAAVGVGSGDWLAGLSSRSLYYRDEWCAIYHADCREVLDEMKCHLVMTDPPYGIHGGRGSMSTNRGRGNYTSDFDDTPEYIRDVVADVIRRCVAKWPTVVTPGNTNMMRYPQPDSFGCYYQPAAVGLQTWGNLDAQPILYYGKNPTKRNFGTPCSYTLTETPEKNGHPCVKPLGAWKRLMASVSVEGMTVLDPFMGSGTTLQAARELGRYAIGIELSEEYCEIAAKRQQQRMMSFG